MASLNLILVYIVLCVLVSALALVDIKTGPGTRSNDAEKNKTHVTVMKKGSHLKMYKSSNGVILSRKDNETSRTARATHFGSTQVDFRDFPKTGQTELSREMMRETSRLPYGVKELPVHPSYKPNDYPPKTEVNPGESYYYNDFGSYSKDSLSKADPIWKFNDISESRYGRFQPGQHLHRRPAPVVEKSSCKQYLEFLRYAFEQLDSTTKKFPNDHQDDYYYYDDDDYTQGESRTLNGKTSGSKPPPMIYPDLGKLRSLAYNDNYGTESSYSYVRNGYMTESESKLSNISETNREAVQSTSVSAASPDIATPSIKSLLVSDFNVQASSLEEKTTELTTEHGGKIHPVTEISKASITMANDQRQIHGVGIENTTSHVEVAEEDKHEGCQDKLFSCPDNVNVTYPVNGYCNRFVVCESGKPNSEFCQEGLHFNLITSQCDLPHNSFCTYSCPRAKGYFGIPGVCGGFFRCSDWYPEYRMCPPRMHWDLKAKICTFQELSSCPLKCDEPYQVKPYNGDCSSYIICTRGEPRYHRCPNGMSFDRELLKCSPKSLSTCTDDEDYITRNRGIENGRERLCANIELKEGKSRWCQEASEGDYK